MKRSILVFFFLYYFIFNGIAQNVNTMGKDFWVSFMPNWPGGEVKLELLITGRHSCTGKVENPYTGWSTTFTVTADSVTTVLIPNSEGLITDNNKIEHKALHVTTTEAVSIYASNFVTCSYDVANVLPTDILMDNYVVQSYMVGFTAKEGPLYSKLLVVATEDNTEIVVNPKGGLTGHIPPFSKKIIKLNRGECYLFISSIGDISGTSIFVKDKKKIAVFSGGDTQIPHNSCCYDAVFEQIMPMAYLGKHFVVTASALRDNDMVRITSVSPDCRISIDGKHKRTLGEHKSYDYKLDSKKKEAIYISTSAPALVCVYLTSAKMGGIMGDPSMVYINPIEQQMDKVTFSTYNTAVTTAHFVNIVTLTGQEKNIVLDGNSIASEFKPVPEKKELSYARVGVTHGSHTLEATTGGFVAHVYGLGQYESYAYSVGSNSKVLNEFDENGNLILNTIPNEYDNLDDKSPDSDEDDQEIVYISTDTLPLVKCDSVSLQILKTGAEIRGVVKNWDTINKEGILVDIVAESNYDYLLNPIEANIYADTIILGITPNNVWCDCFVPSTLKVNVIITYESDDGLRRVVVPMTVPIVRNRSWLSRCLWVLLTIAGLGLLLFYLWGLLKKNRFKRSAWILEQHLELKGSIRRMTDWKKSKRLRDKSFIAWLNRWFVPFRDERRTLNWPSNVPPEAGPITFVAGRSKETVLITRNSISSKLKMTGFDPKNTDDKRTLLDMDPVSVYDNRICKGGLKYDPEGKDDEKYFRIIIGTLIVLAVTIICVLAFLMLKAIL